MDWNIHLCDMARYNQWMNQRLYRFARELGEERVKRDQGAFFGTLFDTLNHILVADRIWLARFAKARPNAASLHPLRSREFPASLRKRLYETLEELEKERVEMDDMLLSFCEEQTTDSLRKALVFVDTEGVQYSQPLGSLLSHLLNHQTHHRGQISTLFFQQGMDVGPTDFTYFRVFREQEKE